MNCTLSRSDHATVPGSTGAPYCNIQGDGLSAPSLATSPIRLHTRNIKLDYATHSQHKYRCGPHKRETQLHIQYLLRWRYFTVKYNLDKTEFRICNLSRTRIEASRTNLLSKLISVALHPWMTPGQGPGIHRILVLPRRNMPRRGRTRRRKCRGKL